MNLIQILEQEEIARLGKKLPEFSPGDTVIVSVNVVVPVASVFGVTVSVQAPPVPVTIAEATAAPVLVTTTSSQ